MSARYGTVLEKLDGLISALGKPENADGEFIQTQTFLPYLIFRPWVVEVDLRLYCQMKPIETIFSILFFPISLTKTT